MSDASLPGHDLPHGDEPGASDTPYADGKGTVGLSDRLRGGAPDTNQGKLESMPPTPAHADPEQAPGPGSSEGLPLDQMSVGAADPQVASTALGGARPQHASTAAEAPADQGIARRAASHQGAAEEPMDTDINTGAARMSPHAAATTTDPPGSAGDAHGVPVASHDAAEGTSETAGIVHGIRAANE